MLDKVIVLNIVHTVIFTDLLNTDMKGWIDKFDNNLEKRLDDMNFVDDVRSDFYINNMDKFDETAHGDEDNNPNDEAYGDIMVEEHPDQEDIFDGTYKKYIGAEVIMVVPGEDPRQSTVRRCVN